MSAGVEYGRVTPAVVESLAGIVGPSNVLAGDDRKNYSRDEAPNAQPVIPEIVVKPGDTAQVSRLMRLAGDLRIPVTPRGAGTGLSGGAVPIYGGIVLSLEKMNRVLHIDVDNFTASVEPGVVLKDLCQAAENQSLYYPVYPGEMTATIGGNVATNAGGMRAVKYGVTRNFLLGLEAVLPGGEIIEAGGGYIKSSTAYDLTQLIAGSEGTLAVITKVLLKLLPPPGRRYVIMVPFPGLDEAIEAVPHVLRRRILPMGIEFLEKDVVHLTEQFLGKETPIHAYEASLMIIVEADADDEADRLAGDIGEVCLAHGAIDAFVASGERALELLAFREKAWPALVQSGKAEMADVVVPRKQIARLVREVRRAGKDLGLSTYMVGHAGDGNVHVVPFLPDAPDGADRVSRFFQTIFELGVSMGGTISGEHGIGYTKKAFLGIAVGPAKLELMKRIKRAFDPQNIMNPGKIFDL